MQRRTALVTMLAAAAIPAVRVRAATTLTDRAWLDPKLLAAARSEGSVVVYSSINEEEAAPIWQIFKDATGINVEYVRGSDEALMARILTEARTQRKTWDIVNNTSVSKMSTTLFVPFDPAGAKGWPAELRDPDRRWYATEQIYDVPAYNTTHLKPSELPKTLRGVPQTSRMGRPRCDQRLRQRVDRRDLSCVRRRKRESPRPSARRDAEARA